MIESIQIKKVASYGETPESLDGLSQFNYVYGANGTGKTTISRVIADENHSLECKTNWRGGIRLQALVYNRDFVDRNFGQDTILKGIFTLGEKDMTIIAKIDAAKAELDSFLEQVTRFTETLQGTDTNVGKTGDLSALESEFDEQCWALKQKHDEEFQAAFTGVRGRKQLFKERLLKESTTNKAATKSITELQEKAGSVFGETPVKSALISELNGDALIAFEADAILKKKIIGKTDVDIAAMIQKLGNSDWVKEGRAFYAVNEAVCPFCQQKTEATLEKSLNEYFDEQFENDSNAIKRLLRDYRAESERIQQTLLAIINGGSSFLDVDKLKIEKDLLDSKIRMNLQNIEKKQKESSQSMSLEPLSDVLVAIIALITAANAAIHKHNTMVANLDQEKKSLTDEVWKYLLEVEIKTHLDAYTTKKDGLNKGIAALTKNINASNESARLKRIEIQELEKSTTSIQPTIDAINSLLTSFGFEGFALAKAQKETHYKIVRPDGTAAKETLSEGEKTFITFLYFYHLLKGSDTATGMTTDRVVVFDDPVSSLDSDVLFIVSNLIKGLFDEVRAHVGHIKQIFILTHNVYFHKEVTYNPHRSAGAAMIEETFWIVKKPHRVSTVQKHTTNPIKTSYELLWTEVRSPNRSNLSIQNTLRRILENYFKILGNINPDEICAKFDGRDKLICKSLFSWVNDGSHYAHDDAYIAIDDGMVDKYLAVFRSIFEKSDHLAHYKMMMGDAFVEAPTIVAAAPTATEVAA